MSAAPAIARAGPAAVTGARPAAALAQPAPAALARRLGDRLGPLWLSRAAWSISRTGRPGMLGLALLFAAALFLVSTHLPVAAEVEALRADLSTPPGRAGAPASDPVAAPVPAPATQALPARADMPAILRQLYDEATRAHLAVDTAKYEVAVTGGGGVVRHRISFPVTGPYPQIRAFIDGTLAAMPAVALSELTIERKAIEDGDVEAQLRLTVFTRSGP